VPDRRICYDQNARSGLWACGLRTEINLEALPVVNLRSFEVPTVVKHAPGAITLLADQVKALGSKRPMLVTDKGLVSTGLVNEAANTLKAGNVDYVLFDGVVANPPIELVDEAAELFKSEGCDGLIGFGGGSPMDTAKSIGVVATEGGSMPRSRCPPGRARPHAAQ
jgi:choline dehydrogenase